MSTFPHSFAAQPFIILGTLALAITVHSRAEDATAGTVAEEPVRLESLIVQTDRAQDEDYKAERSRIGTKTDTPLQDVPQSITVVTSGQILDQQMTSLADVVRYVPGVISHQGENNRDQIIFRGNSSSADFFVNGVRDDVQYYRDLYNLDRVEILRGPNALAFGRGGGGGVINRATKDAEFSRHGELSFQAGSFDQARTALDFNQPLNGKFAARLNAVYEDAGSFRHGVGLQREGLNPTVTFRPQKSTRFTLGYEYFRDVRTADRGITSFAGRPAGVPTDTFYGNPDESHVHATVGLLSAAFEHRAGNLTIRSRAMFGDYDRGYQNFVPGAASADQATVLLTAYNNSTQRQNIFSQTDVIYTVSTGDVRHTLLSGVEFGRQRTRNFRNTGFFNNSTTAIPVPFYNPLTTTPVTWRQSATDANNRVETNLGAVYAQDQIELNRHLQAIAGVRFDSFDLQYHNRRNGDVLGRRDGLVSPRVGLIYKPRATISVYGSYGVSFLPSSGDQFSSLTTVTQQVRPEKFTNYEIGTKWDLPRNLFLTAAVYQLDRTNTRATDPNDPTRIVQTGSQRTQGFEFGLTGSITEAWTVSTGYAYQDARITQATAAAAAGATVGQVPRHNFSWWNKYQFSPKLSAGAGVVYRSRMFATIDDSVVLPGYAEIDAAIYYMLNARWRLQINAENLGNHRYYRNADSNTNISPGSPFAAHAGLTHRF